MIISTGLIYLKSFTDFSECQFLAFDSLYTQ
uniref:Uncharacterized protein n=1 Tax=Siphoviridae sp. ctgN495 TaxID=2825608 RepID=A0A8S5UCX3_9CAUD|nr:MAG TPA: hypothetical protein [Siphoviridae sp. ctgN495]